MLACPEVNCNLVLSEPQGDITSPCYPADYPKSQACRWTLRAPVGHIVELTFLDFELEKVPGCPYDRAVVNTGSADVLFCGVAANGLTLNSTGNVLELTFHSDSIIEKRGFSVSYRHVAVALRNQKLTIAEGEGNITKVASSVSIPTLYHLTVCFELARSNTNQNEFIFFTYDDDDGDVMLSLGANKDGMLLLVDGQSCSLENGFSSGDITATMRPFCVTWSSAGGRAAVYFNGNYRAKTCAATSGRSVAPGDEFRLGGRQSFDGMVYNFRLWDYAMPMQQLAALTCDSVGNVLDWDNSYWVIPSSLAHTDAALSCTRNNLLPTTTSPTISPTTPTTTSPTTPLLSHAAFPCFPHGLMFLFCFFAFTMFL